MFNLTKHKAALELNPLVRELPLLGIKAEPESISLVLGDETLSLPTVADCLENIKKGINELKGRLWQSWMALKKTCEELLEQPGQNNGGLENTLFIYNIKKAYALAGNFTQLAPVQDAIRNLLYLDIAQANVTLIRKYNALFFRCRMLHRLTMREIYRTKLLNRWGKMNKKADAKLKEMLRKIATETAGPSIGDGLDLEMSERMWPYDSAEEELLEDRQKAKRRQTRYNPEYYDGEDGIYFKWVDRNRDPYLWEGDQSDSCYPSRSYMQIP